MKRVKLPSFLAPCLASYDLNQLDIKKDKKLIITSILNNASEKELNWLVNTYSKREIKDVIKEPTRGLWYENILRYWIKIFDINLPKSVYNKAIIRF